MDNLTLNFRKIIEQFLIELYTIHIDDSSIYLLSKNLINFCMILNELSIPKSIKKDIIIQLIKNKKFYFDNTNSLFYGLPLLSLLIYNNKQLFFDNEYDKYQEIIVSEISEQAIDYSGEMKNFEYIKGLSGTINYLLFIKNHEPYYFEKYYIKLYNESIQRLIDFVLSDSIFKEPINLGLSHGISGILLIVSLVYKNYDNVLLRKGLYKILDFLIHIDLNQSPLPSIIDDKTNIYAKVRPSWCYSELGVYHSIIISSNFLGLYSISYIYKNKIINLINNIEDYKIISSNFCHGYSGVLVFNKIYNNNNHNVKNYIMNLLYKECSNDITSTFLDCFYTQEMTVKKETNLSFLDGSFSVLLSLLFISDYQNIIWEEILLVKTDNR